MFISANLLNASFEFVKPQNANFNYSQLQNVNFENAQLQNAVFCNADLQNTIFCNADLQYANFEFVNFNKDYNNIDEAIFGNTLWNEKTNFKGTFFENKTIEELTKIMGNPPIHNNERLK